MHRPIVAIDGPAGAGKSTVAKYVAARLGYTYIDTGAMYRAVAVRAIEAGIPIDQPERIVELANRLDIRFAQDDGRQLILVDSEDLTDAVRTPAATKLSSPVSAIPGVRHRLVEMQRRMGEKGGIVMEGRDIGTYVFPDAEVKIFMTASQAERVKRRCGDLEKAGMPADPEIVAREIRERDDRDSTRDMAPLRQAEDAVHIDTDGMTVDQVVEEIVRIHDQRTGTCCSG